MLGRHPHVGRPARTAADRPHQHRPRQLQSRLPCTVPADRCNESMSLRLPRRTQRPVPMHTRPDPPGYQSRISGPLLDRIDLHARATAIEPAQLRRSDEKPESTESVAVRVESARDIQRQRQHTCNGNLDPAGVDQICVATSDAQELKTSSTGQCRDFGSRPARTTACSKLLAPSRIWKVPNKSRWRTSARLSCSDKWTSPLAPPLKGRGRIRESECNFERTLRDNCVATQLPPNVTFGIICGSQSPSGGGFCRVPPV